MNDLNWSQLIIFLLSMLVMALAAAVHASAMLIGRGRLKHLSERHNRKRGVQSLLDPRRSLEASILLVQAIGLVVASSALTTLLRPWAGGAGQLIAILTVAALYLLFGQSLPRALAIANPDQTANTLVTAAGALAWIVKPFTALADGFTTLWLRVIPHEPGATDPAAEDDLRAAIEIPDDGVIEPEERQMIDAVLRLEDTPVRDIMTPRVDMVTVEIRSTAAEIVAAVTAAGHSRLPVYRDTIDQIAGILYAKDLLPFVIGNTLQLPLERLLRPPYIVPESKRLDVLLTEMRRDHIHIALVFDEYGGAAGLVTIEDIIEEIVGDIQDEYDLEPVLLERISPDTIVVDGSIELDEVEEALGVDLRDGDDEVTTAGGFVQSRLERMPLPGDMFESDGVRVEVIAIEGHRLRRVLFSRVTGAPAPALDDPSDNPAGEPPAEPGNTPGTDGAAGVPLQAVE